MNILQQARKRQGLTQTQMALKLNLSMRAIASYEQSKRHIKVCDLLKVAKAYSMSDDEILAYLEQVAR
ncbi:helix-turn-helix transcriptional regulator [Romboutsia sp. 1001216sp1]|uniref:helix-turn-helix domain-containing protein n=1 Tax=unclassified Romboutsia TaxID=2626894 RepID=UPI0018AB7CA1|nr:MULTISPECIES: helix-turn-helix transcriptional regulator [unclassified Romboutsia]MDB8794290.1 helix-turn-helix transcriptional regulator [Romboutsia sp. 1001216sp1]MDB8796459.1 helix-turn-helix transcriptional regulator [Romboutsia sp. 1001216sp1]MDB8797788.1 helix-turn-helix transcriptional regulator [Romboutsia sp. 1001216sp1]